jgi:ubiquitin-protein ligase
MTERRLSKEARYLASHPIEGVTIVINESEIKKWYITLQGPINSPYEGQTYSVKFVFPLDYPFSPPAIVMSTAIFHPNISHRGDICLAILKDDWTPSNTTKKVIEQLLTILTVPNIDDPLDVGAASLYVNDYPEFVRRVAERYGS